MIFKRKKETVNRLLKSFGKVKDDVFNFELIEKYFRNKNNTNTFQVLSDRTCNDLDFQELFMFIDRTTSKIGQQYLYNKLRVIHSKPANTKNSEKIIDKITTDINFRISVQKQLEKLTKKDAYYITTIFQEEHIRPPKWFFVFPILSFFSFSSIVLTFFHAQFLILLLLLFVVNTIFHYWNKRNLFQYLVSIPQLLILNNIARELFKKNEFTSLNPNLPKSLDTTDKIRNRMSFFKLEAKLQGDLEAIFWGLFEILKIFFLIEPLLLFGVLKLLDTRRKEIEEIFDFIGEIDSFLSIASLRNGLNHFCIPEIISSQKYIEAKNIYHPLIPNCIENNIQTGKKSILLTGSNMSGKTSFIRTIGINAITGLTLNTCFASNLSMSKMRIFSAIRISDDLMNDKSYYFEEVLTIKKMIDKSMNDIPNLFLLDEIFKGTNTIERISAGKAILSSLSKEKNIVFVSTHDIELADLLKDEYELFNFSETIDNKMVDFDYKLKNGKLKTRNAIKILQINDYPQHIINEAIEISKELDKITKANNNL